MEKIIAGQKVVRIAKDQEPGFFNAKCRAAGIDPKSALTVTSVSDYGKWLGLDGLTVEGESHPWKRNNFEPFIEPAEASRAVVFTCAKGPITVGCMVRRKKAYLDPNWITAIKDVGLDPEDVFKVSFCDSDTLIGIASDQCPDVDLGSWGKMYFELVEQAQKSDADGWIEWHGGECTVGGDVLVDYRMRDGTGEYLGEGVKVRNLRWDHKDWPGDIVAYRLHVKEKTEEQKLRDRLDILESGYNEEINKRINAEREASEKIAKLESQLTDERQERMKREQLVARLRVILGENGRELKDRRSQVEMMLCLLGAADNRVKELDQVIANHSKLMQAQGVVIEQSRDNVKLALVLAASPEISGDAVESMDRLVRIDQRCQDEKISKMMDDRHVVDMPF